MNVQLNEYVPVIVAFGVIGGLLLLQLLVADVIGIVRGHTPGTGLENDHKNLLFRAARAHANTNESVSVFIVLALFAMAVSAAPAWVNNLSIAYIVGRIGHMVCYYANLKILRSVFFALSIAALLGLLFVGWSKWFSV